MSTIANVSLGVTVNKASLTQAERDIQAAISRIEKLSASGALIGKGYTQPLGRITGAANEFEKSLEAANARVVAFGASAGAILLVQRALEGLVRSTIEVEKSLTEINTLLNLSSSGLSKFGDQLFAVASGTGQAFEVASKAALEFSRQGLGLEETLKRTRDALILSRLSGLDVVASTTALTAAMNSFNESVIDSTELVNKLANVDAAFAVSSADLAEAIKRVGSTAQDAGVGIDELIALVTSAQQVTARGGSVIGNSLKTIFTRAQRPEVLNDLHNFGVAVKDSSGAALPAIQILKNFANAYDGLSSSQKSSSTELLGGVYQINILKAAIGDLGKEFSIYDSALRTSSSATNEASVRNEVLNKTLSALLIQTTNNLTKVGAAAGKLTIEPALRNVLGFVNDSLDELSEKNPEDVGSKIGKGILEGIGRVISGPGLILFGALFGKLAVNFISFSGNALKTFAGLNEGARHQAELQQLIQNLLLKNPQLINAATSSAQGQLAVEKEILRVVRDRNSALQKSSDLSEKMAANIALQSPRPSRGRAAGGLIPNFAASDKNSEIISAIAGGYNPGQVKQMSLPGVGRVTYNTAETVKQFPGMSQPAIMPPQQSEAGERYGKSFQKAHGFDPYAAGGFVPNFLIKGLAGRVHGERGDAAILEGRIFEALLNNKKTLDLTENTVGPDITQEPYIGYEAKRTGMAAFNDSNFGLGKAKGGNLVLPQDAKRDFDSVLVKQKKASIKRAKGYPMSMLQKLAIDTIKAESSKDTDYANVPIKFSSVRQQNPTHPNKTNGKSARFELSGSERAKLQEESIWLAMSNGFIPNFEKTIDPSKLTRWDKIKYFNPGFSVFRQPYLKPDGTGVGRKEISKDPIAWGNAYEMFLKNGGLQSIGFSDPKHILGGTPIDFLARYKTGDPYALDAKIGHDDAKSSSVQRKLDTMIPFIRGQSFQGRLFKTEFLEHGFKEEELDRLKTGIVFGNASDKETGSKQIARAATAGVSVGGKSQFANMSSGFVPNFDRAFARKGEAVMPGPAAFTKIYKDQLAKKISFLDFDGTLIHTKGDVEYAKASTPEAKSKVLQDFFTNPGRINDIKSAKLTSFGSNLKAKIDANKILPNLLGIMTASDKTAGIPEYINRTWKIPMENQRYGDKTGTKAAEMAKLRAAGKAGEGPAVGRLVDDLAVARGFVPNFNSEPSIHSPELFSRQPGSRSTTHKLPFLGKSFGRLMGLVNRFNENPLFTGTVRYQKGVGLVGSLSHFKDFLEREDPGLRRTVGLAEGFVPNLADVRKIEHYKSGELGEENRIVAGKGSSLRYIEDEERFSIDYHSSKNKGDGFAQFQELATLSHKSGKPIYSNSLSAQRNRLGLAQKRSTNFGALRAFYPQLDYRMIGGFVTEGDYAHEIRDLAGGPPEKLSLKFKSLADVQKKVDVRNIERDEYNNALGFDDVYLSGLTTKRIKEGPGDASLRNASKGFVPNFNALKDSIDREKAAGYSSGQIRVGKDSSLVTSWNPDGAAVFNSTEGSLKRALSMHRSSGKSPEDLRSQGASKGFVPNLAVDKIDVAIMMASLLALSTVFKQLSDSGFILTKTQKLANEARLKELNIQKRALSATKTANVQAYRVARENLRIDTVIGGPAAERSKAAAAKAKADLEQSKADLAANRTAARDLARSTNNSVSQLSSRATANASQLGMAAAFTAPMISSIASQFVNTSTSGGAKTKAGIEGAGGIASLAGTGAAIGAMIPIPGGALIGAGIGAAIGIAQTIGLVSEAGEKFKLDQVTSEIEKVNTASQQVSQGFQSYIDGADKLRAFFENPEKYKPEDLNRIEDQMAKSMQGIPEEFRDKFRSSLGSVEKMREVFSDITENLNQQKQGLESSAIILEMTMGARKWQNEDLLGGGLAKMNTPKARTAISMAANRAEIQKRIKEGGTFDFKGITQKNIQEKLKGIFDENFLSTLSDLDGGFLGIADEGFSKFLVMMHAFVAGAQKSAADAKLSKEIQMRSAEENREWAKSIENAKNRVSDLAVALASLGASAKSRAVTIREIAEMESKSAFDQRLSNQKDSLGLGKAFMSEESSARAASDLKIQEFNVQHLDKVQETLRKKDESVIEILMKSYSDAFAKYQQSTSNRTPNSPPSTQEQKDAESFVRQMRDYPLSLAPTLKDFANQNLSDESVLNELIDQIKKAGIGQGLSEKDASDKANVVREELKAIGEKMVDELAKMETSNRDQILIERQQLKNQLLLIEQQKRLQSFGGAADYSKRGKTLFSSGLDEINDLLEERFKAISAQGEGKDVAVGRNAMQYLQTLMQNFGAKNLETNFPEEVGEVVRGRSIDILRQGRQLEVISSIRGTPIPDALKMTKEKADKLAIEQVSNQLKLESLPDEVEKIRQNSEDLNDLIKFQGLDLVAKNTEAFKTAIDMSGLKEAINADSTQSVTNTGKMMAPLSGIWDYHQQIAEATNNVETKTREVAVMQKFRRDVGGLPVEEVNRKIQELQGLGKTDLENAQARWEQFENTGGFSKIDNSKWRTGERGAMQKAFDNALRILDQNKLNRTSDVAKMYELGLRAGLSPAQVDARRKQSGLTPKESVIGSNIKIDVMNLYGSELGPTAFTLRAKKEELPNEIFKRLEDQSKVITNLRRAISEREDSIERMPKTYRGKTQDERELYGMKQQLKNINQGIFPIDDPLSDEIKDARAVLSRFQNAVQDLSGKLLPQRTPLDAIDFARSFLLVVRKYLFLLDAVPTNPNRPGDAKSSPKNPNTSLVLGTPTGGPSLAIARNLQQINSRAKDEGQKLSPEDLAEKISEKKKALFENKRDKGILDPKNQNMYTKSDWVNKFFSFIRDASERQGEELEAEISGLQTAQRRASLVAKTAGVFEKMLREIGVLPATTEKEKELSLKDLAESQQKNAKAVTNDARIAAVTAKNNPTLFYEEVAKYQQAVVDAAIRSGEATEELIKGLLETLESVDPKAVEKAISDRRIALSTAIGKVGTALKDPGVLTDEIADLRRAVVDAAIRSGELKPEMVNELSKARRTLDPKRFQMDKIDANDRLDILHKESKRAEQNEDINFAEERANAKKAEIDEAIKQGKLQPGMVKKLLKSRLDYGGKEALRDSVNALDDFVVQFPDKISGALNEALSGAKTFRQAFSDIFADMGKGLLGDAMKSGVKLIINSLTNKNSGGIVRGYSLGGQVSGGSGTRDDIPAMLSSGEYVVRKAAVNKYGSDFLEKLNKGSLVKRAAGGSADILEQLQYTYDNKDRPSEGEFETGGLSLLAIQDQNNPQVKIMEAKEAALRNYLVEKAAFDQAQRDAIKAFKKQQRGQAIMALVQAAISVAGNSIPSKPSKLPKGIEPTMTAGPLDPERLRMLTDNSGARMSVRSARWPRRRFHRFASGGPSGVDDIPALLTGGEYVMRKDSVEHYGEDFFNRLNRGSIKGYADGGLVGGGRGETVGDTFNKSSVSGGLTNNITISVNITNEGSVSDSKKDQSGTANQEQQDQGKLLSEKVEAKIVEILLQEKRPGGILYNPNTKDN